jgi:hypothetical protein
VMHNSSSSAVQTTSHLPTWPDADMEAGLGGWPCVEPGPSARGRKEPFARRSGGVYCMK